MPQGKAVKIYVINLKKDLEKRQEMQAQLNLMALDAIFINAIHGRSLLDTSPNIASCLGLCAPAQRPKELSPGELGCLLSHRLIWKEIAQKGQAAVVLEDDALLGPDFAQLLPSLNELPQGVECLLLGHQRQIYPCGFRIESPVYKKGQIDFCNHKIARLIAGGNGAFAYFLRPKLAQEFLEAKYLAPADWYTSGLLSSTQYALMPPSVSIAPKYLLSSTTQSKQPKNRPLFSKLLKRFKNYLRFLPQSFMTPPST